MLWGFRVPQTLHLPCSQRVYSLTKWDEIDISKYNAEEARITSLKKKERERERKERKELGEEQKERFLEVTAFEQ